MALVCTTVDGSSRQGGVSSVHCLETTFSTRETTARASHRFFITTARASQQDWWAGGHHIHANTSSTTARVKKAQPHFLRRLRRIHLSNSSWGHFTPYSDTVQLQRHHSQLLPAVDICTHSSSGWPGREPTKAPAPREHAVWTVSIPKPSPRWPLNYKNEPVCCNMSVWMADGCTKDAVLIGSTGKWGKMSNKKRQQRPFNMENRSSINTHDHLSDSVTEIWQTSSINVPLSPFIRRGEVSWAQKAFLGL